MSNDADQPLNASAVTRVQTGARLHFGLLSNRPLSGREFGGVGLMIDQPGWTVRVARHDCDVISLHPSVEQTNVETSQRAERFLKRYRQQFAPELEPVRIDIESAIPGHQGLGSGTQLGLAIAKGLALLMNADATSEQLAKRIERGRRSAVGIWGFDYGGFIVDGGKRPDDDIGVLVARFDVPAEWRFVLISPHAQEGLSGAAEIAAFGQLPPMTEELTQQLSRLILTRILPALRQHEFNEFSQSLFEYGRLVGHYFAPAQGGVFAAPMMQDIAARLFAQDFAGPIQTSWGPTCAIPCRSIEEAESVTDFIQKSSTGTDLQITVVKALNRGAQSHLCGI